MPTGRRDDFAGESADDGFSDGHGRQDQGGLSFDRADYGGANPQGVVCAFCREAVTTEYYDINGTPVCDECEPAVREAWMGGTGASVRAVRAATAGLAAAVAGGAIYGGVAFYSGYEIGLIALVVGLMVGHAVRWGAEKRGGLGYQLWGCLLTYLGVTQWVTVATALREDLTLFQIFEVAKAAFMLPVTAGFGGSQLIGLLIIGIGVYEAWALNRKVPFRITGPLRVGSA